MGQINNSLEAANIVVEKFGIENLKDLPTNDSTYEKVVMFLGTLEIDGEEVEDADIFGELYELIEKA